VIAIDVIAGQQHPHDAMPVEHVLFVRRSDVLPGAVQDGVYPFVRISTNRSILTVVKVENVSEMA